MIYQRKEFIEEWMRRNTPSPAKEKANQIYLKRGSKLNSIFTITPYCPKRDSVYFDGSILAQMAISHGSKKNNLFMKKKQKTLKLTTSTNIFLKDYSPDQKGNFIYKNKHPIFDGYYYSRKNSQKKILKGKNFPNIKRQLTPFEKGKSRQYFYKQYLSKKQHLITNPEIGGEVLKPIASFKFLKTLNEFRKSKSKLALIRNTSEDFLKKNKIKNFKLGAYFNNKHLNKMKNTFHFNNYLDSS